MKQTATALGLFFFLSVLTPGSALSVTDVEWNDSVQAAEAVDSTLSEPPLTGTNVSVVGGGNTASGTNFAFSAFRRDGTVSGRMTMTDHLGNTSSAEVFCITAVVGPGGRGGTAQIIGTLTKTPTPGVTTMVFDVLDSDQPGGELDRWNGGVSNDASCDTPPAPVDEVANGNIAVRSLD
jgi:hypothetical protein